MEKRNALGFYYMGRLYDEGHVVERDRDKAVEYYKKAVECDIGTTEEEGVDMDSRMARQRLKELNA